jgi:tRNA dimethylallyltransferase
MIIVGPTGSGKTTLSVLIAGKLDAEIVSADSRQLYQYLNIGTAKPDLDEQSGIPHHCLDLCPPDRYFSAGEYAKTARACIRRILKKNRLPIVVGGSGLYVQALVDGVFQGDYRDADIRDGIRKQAENTGWGALYQELQRIDPQSAGQIHENDHKRIVRSLEVYRLAGKPISEIKKEKTVPADFYPVFIGIKWPRQILYARIEQRVDQMIDKGLVSEVRKILDMGYSKTLNSLDSVGYKEIIAYFENKYTWDEAVATIKRNTRRFAKRQMTWFRRDKRIHWFSVEHERRFPGIADEAIRIHHDMIDGRPA